MRVRLRSIRLRFEWLGKGKGRWCLHSFHDDSLLASWPYVYLQYKFLG